MPRTTPRLFLQLCMCVLSFFGNPILAQNRANRQDEKRENQRVNDAKQNVQRSQQRLSAAIKEFRVQNTQVIQADRKLLATRAAYHLAQEAAEVQLEGQSGLPELIRKMRGLRDEIAMLSKPIVATLSETDEWRAALAQREAAVRAKEKLLADHSRTDTELSAELAELEKRIDSPDTLTAAALDAAPKVKERKVAYHQTLDEIAELRRSLDSSKVDADPEVRSTKHNFELSQREVATQRKQLASHNTLVAQHQSELANANRKLQQAQTNDQQDRNQPKPKKKNGKSN